MLARARVINSCLSMTPAHALSRRRWLRAQNKTQTELIFSDGETSFRGRNSDYRAGMGSCSAPGGRNSAVVFHSSPIRSVRVDLPDLRCWPVSFGDKSKEPLSNQTSALRIPQRESVQLTEEEIRMINMAFRPALVCICSLLVSVSMLAGCGSSYKCNVYLGGSRYPTYEEDYSSSTAKEAETACEAYHNGPKLCGFAGGCGTTCSCS